MIRFKFPIKALAASIISFTVIIAVLITAFLRNTVLSMDYNLALKLSEIEGLVSRDYYFSVDDAELSDAVMTGYMKGLKDTYANYYTKENAQKQIADLKGDSFGIGALMVYLSDENALYVWKVYDNSSANAAGLKSGDYIVKVNGKTVYELGYNGAINAIRGEKGKQITLTVLRNNQYKSLKVSCAENDVQSVYSKLLQKKYGYVEVIDFNQKTAAQFKVAVDELQNEGAKALIIDLRHNGGGTVASAADMLNYLLPKGDTIRVKYKNGKTYVRNRSDKKCVNLPMAILTDGGTASSSEIFCSTMRDFGKAKLIGEKTYGKSVIQRSYNLSDGSRVKFTIGEFIPKSGKSYHKIGLEPDIAVDSGFQNDAGFYLKTPENDKVLLQSIAYLKGQLS